MTTWAVDDGLDLRRWMACGAVVALAHLAIGGAFALRRSDIERTDPAGAIVVEFSPVPVAPQFQQMEIPPGPEQVMSEAVPESPFHRCGHDRKLATPCDIPTAAVEAGSPWRRIGCSCSAAQELRLLPRLKAGVSTKEVR